MKSLQRKIIKIIGKEEKKRSKKSLQINSEVSRAKSNSEDMKATTQVLQKFEDSETTKSSYVFQKTCCKKKK